MPRIPSGWQRDRAEPYLPHLGHVSEHVLALEDGSLMSMASLRGISHELRAHEERNVAADILNRIYCDFGDDNVTVCAHFVRWPTQAVDIPDPRFRNEFSRQLWRAYRDDVLSRLFTNEWFISLIVSPRTIPLGSYRLRRRLGQLLHPHRKSTPDNVTELAEIEDLWTQVSHNLAGYNLQRLGYRYQGEGDWVYRFSAIGEAMKRIVGTPGPVPVVNGPIGRIVASDSDQRVFERRIFRTLPPGCDDEADDAEGVLWGSIYGLNDYMQQTHPNLMDDLLSLPMPLVLSQSYGFDAKQASVFRLVNKRRHMRTSNDSAIEERKRLRRAASRTTDGAIRWGIHQVSLAVYGHTYREQLANSGRARAALVNTAADIAIESAGNKAAFWSQLPGNFAWQTAPGRIPTDAFVDFANFGAFPMGNPKGWWGASIPLKTTANTIYFYDPFVEDVGMTAVFGATTSGKTTLMTFIMALMDQYMVDRPGLFVLFDKDRGCEIFIEAFQGNYLNIVPGEPSGFAPLRGFREDTPYARHCIARLVKSCILMDGHGPLSPADEERIARGTAAQMRLPVEMRSMLGLRQFLGWKDALGAGPRFNRWCRGGALGWLFDGDRDDLNLDVPAVGFNLGPILDTPELVEVAVQHLYDRIAPYLDGRRVAGFFDEFNKYGTAEAVEEAADDFWRTWRKQNGLAFLATQSAEDMIGTKRRRAILAQCYTMIFCPSPSADDDICKGKHIRCTEGELEAIKSKMMPGSRYVLIKRRGMTAESVIVNLDLAALPSWMIDVLSGRINNVNAWRAIDSGLSEGARLLAFAEKAQSVVN